MKDLIMNLSIKQKITICIIFVLIILAGFIFIYRYYYSSDETIITGQTTSNEVDTNDNEIDLNNIKDENDEETNDKTFTSKIGIAKEENKIKVYVTGEVNSPGVVSLNEKSRIVDAIEAAGGKTENADLTKINLAYILDDGVQICVPRIGQASNDKETYITDEAGEGVITDELISQNTKNSKVNINTANSEKLQTIPGVGEATAQKIIKYREEKGKFKTKEDIKNVEGIGDAKYEKLKDYIEVK